MTIPFHYWSVFLMKPPLMPTTSDRSTPGVASLCGTRVSVLPAMDQSPSLPRPRPSLQAQPESSLECTPVTTASIQTIHLSSHGEQLHSNCPFFCLLPPRLLPGSAVMNREINGLEFLRLTEPR